MSTKNKYRVKVVISSYELKPTRKYVIQKKTFLGWVNQHDPVTDIGWAHQTCEEMNKNYGNKMVERNA